MISKSEKQAFAARVSELRLNPDALEEVRIHAPGEQLVIQNADGKRNSLQIFAAITSNDGYISPSQAERGLEIYGYALRQEAEERPGTHAAIDFLETLAARKESVRADVIRRNFAKPLTFPIECAIYAALSNHPTPFILYDVHTIRKAADSLNRAFSWTPGFKNFFAVKACPNPFILEQLVSEEMGADCSSKPELLLASSVGLKGEDIMFTSNDTPKEEFKLARKLGAIINLDDITHIDVLESAAGIPELVCIRYNPGQRRVGNSLIGTPVESKYGFTYEQVFEGLAKLRELGAKRFGLHTMIASNELNPEYFVETARMMFTLKQEVRNRLGIEVEFLNLGGGIGTPYKPEQREVDLSLVSRGIKAAHQQMVVSPDLPPAKIFMENGRLITGPSGYLVTRVRHVTHKYKDFVGVDACMSNLMRPAMYGAYHHITILGREDATQCALYDVTGSLCENNDKFAVNRSLPRISQNDVLVIHNAGAHGYAMGFQYNGKLRCAEFILNGFGAVSQIRRAETERDYFATFDFEESRFPPSRFELG